jgi:hypothetical protein
VKGMCRCAAGHNVLSDWGQSASHSTHASATETSHTSQVWGCKAWWVVVGAVRACSRAQCAERLGAVCHTLNPCLSNRDITYIASVEWTVGQAGHGIVGRLGMRQGCSCVQQGTVC